MALVTCRAACAKPMSPVVAYGIFPVNFHTTRLLSHAHVHFDCAGSHETGPGAAFFLQIFASNGSCDMSMCISTVQTGTKEEISHRNLAKRPPLGSPQGDLAKRPLMEILVQRSCQETSYRDLANRALIEFLCRDLVKRVATLLRDLL